MTRYPLSFLAALLVLLAPGFALSAPGEATPDFGDDDDDDDDDGEDEEPEGEDEPEGPVFEDDVEDADPGGDAPQDEPDDEDEEGGPELDLPELEDSTRVRPPEDEETSEDEESLDDRYRVVVPGSEEDDRRRSDRRSDDGPIEEEDDGQPRGLVKVIQKKFFLKYRRVEIVPQIGYIGNDHFIRRLVVGASIGFHVNEILEFEVLIAGLPDLGETDYKPLTRRFRNEEEVVPDISRVTFLSVLNFNLSPIYGKVELGTLRVINYDIYVGAGAGMAYSKDDTAIIRSPCDEHENVRQRKADVANGCQYVDQAHFVTNIGGGLRIVFNEWIGVRLDARQFTHIEQVYREGDIGLEMKQNFMVSLGASLFFPPKARGPSF